MPPYRLRSLHQPMTQATARYSEAKLKEVMPLSDLTEDKFRNAYIGNACITRLEVTTECREHRTRDMGGPPCVAGWSPVCRVPRSRDAPEAPRPITRQEVTGPRYPEGESVRRCSACPFAQCEWHQAGIPQAAL